MDVFQVIEKRRSVRRFTAMPVPEAVIEKAVNAATLAPNSSNVQTWDFYWVKSEPAKSELRLACFNQSAARTAAELLVLVADRKSWRRSQPQLVQYVASVNAPPPVQSYYRKLIPMVYRQSPFFGWFKSLGAAVVGLFRPVPRGPFSSRDLREVCVKSAALAAENFVLATTAQGFATCMMEGFDEARVRRILKLPCSATVVMVIAVGEEGDNGVWGPRFRIPIDQVFHKV